MYYTIFEHLNINEDELININAIRDDDFVFVQAKIKPSHQKCPYCENDDTVIKEYKTKTFKRTNMSGISYETEIKIPRYRCKKCGKTFSKKIENGSHSKTPKSVIQKMKDLFLKPISFSDIADTFNMSVTQVVRIFDSMNFNYNATISEAICIDEFRNTGDNEQKYACVIVNFLEHNIVDILPSRTLPYLREYMKKQPKTALNSVKYIITDMYDGYLTIAREYFTNAIIAIDPFHYMRYFTDALQRLRIRYKDYSYNDITWFNKNWKLYTADEDFLDKKNYVLATGIVISFKDRMKRFLTQNNELKTAYYLLQDYYYIVKNNNVKNGLEFIEEMIKRMRNTEIPELVSCSNTWEHYKIQIANSFIFYKGKRLSNGPIEGINSRIKTLKKVYCGYKNKKRFYKRVIAIINKKR